MKDPLDVEVGNLATFVGRLDRLLLVLVEDLSFNVLLLDRIIHLMDLVEKLTYIWKETHDEDTRELVKQLVESVERSSGLHRRIDAPQAGFCLLHDSGVDEAVRQGGWSGSVCKHFPRNHLRSLEVRGKAGLVCYEPTDQRCRSTLQESQ